MLYFILLFVTNILSSFARLEICVTKPESYITACFIWHVSIVSYNLSVMPPTPNAPTWIIGPISNPRLTWGEVRRGHVHRCSVCGVVLLTGEYPGFCCGPNGSKYNEVQPLPPLPPEYNTFLNHPDISSQSRILNLIFSFASMETTHPFPAIAGPPGFVAIQGKVYHRVRPTHTNSAVRWLLYDGFLEQFAPHANWASVIPPLWLTAMRAALLNVNPFVSSRISCAVGC